jgi:hypothetical protein
MGEEASPASYVVEGGSNGFQGWSSNVVDLEAPAPGAAASSLENSLEISHTSGDVGGRSEEEGSDVGLCEHKHYSHRSPWLRAMVLGANDGLVSIASLMLGVGAVKNDAKSMIVSGIAGLVAGACSMAIGEFVSVFSQRDSELADVEKERQVQTTTLSINTNPHLFVKFSSELLSHLCNDFQLQCAAPRAGNWPWLY